METCIDCKNDFEYSRAKGHRKNRCSSCWQKRKKAKRKAKCVAYKGGKCLKCGYNKCHRAMGFHHRDPKTKSFGISEGITNSWEILKKELDKCDLLCSNCHMELEEALACNSTEE